MVTLVLKYLIIGLTAQLDVSEMIFNTLHSNTMGYHRDTAIG